MMFYHFNCVYTLSQASTVKESMKHHHFYFMSIIEEVYKMLQKVCKATNINSHLREDLILFHMYNALIFSKLKKNP